MKNMCIIVYEEEGHNLNRADYNNEALIEARKQAGYKTQADFAKALHVARKTVNRAELGIIVSFQLLSRMARLCDKEVADFLRNQHSQKNLSHNGTKRVDNGTYNVP